MTTLPLEPTAGTNESPSGENSNLPEGNKDLASGVSLSDILNLKHKNVPMKQILKFWLLVSVTFGSFLFWTPLFTYLGNVEWVKETPLANPLSPSNGTDNSFQTRLRGYCIDIWFAFATIAALDAAFIVFDFNRALIHQWHYFVGMAMMALGSFIALGTYWIGNLPSLGISQVAWPIFVCGCLYAGTLKLLNVIHTLMPSRGRSKTHGSLESFSANICQFDLPWRRTVFYAALNGSVGWLLLRVLPPSLYVLNPIIQVGWEVTFLSKMGTKQTARYMIFATPLIQGAVCVEWGLRQLSQAGLSLSIHPLLFISLVILGRVFLDLHLAVLLSSRDDLHWARRDVVPSTPKVVVGFGVMWLFEVLTGIPVISYVKPLAVVGLHASACLVFLLCGSYAIVFDKIKNIRGRMEKEE